MPVSHALLAAWQQAEAYAAQGDLAAARDVLEPAAEVATSAYGPDHPDVLETLRRLALVHRAAADWAAARRVLEEALAAGLLRLGDADPLMLALSAELGTAAEQLGNRHEARRNFTRVAQYGPGVLGHDHPYVHVAQSYLGGEAAGPVYIPPQRPAPAEPAPRPAHPQPQPQPAEAPRQPPQPQPQPAEPQRQPAMPHRSPAEQQPPSRAAAVPPPPPAPATHRPVLVPEPEPGVWRTAPETPARFGPPPAPSAPAAPSPQPHHSRVPLLVLTVIATAGVLAAAVFAVLTFLVPPRTPATGASAGPSVPVLTPPADVKLRDNGASITLTWTDPDAGTLPFIVSGGRAGEQSHPYPPLPPGQTTFTVNGLNADVDYCFTVVAVYTTNEFAPSDLVCTRRRAGPSPTTT